MPYLVKTFSYGASGSATPLHDGTNSSSNPPKYVHSFMIRVDGGATVYIGASDVTGATNGVTVDDGDAFRAHAPLSRGESGHYDLTQIYCVGGSFRLDIEQEIR